MCNTPLFTGCAAALVTPMTPDGDLDETALRRLLAMQLDAGMDAVAVLGTTGEPCTLDFGERERVIAVAVEVCGGRMPVIVGTGSNDTKRAVAYAKQAQALGADGQLCVTPYYNKATQDGLLRHYGAVLDACALPAILYNVPSRTGMSIAPQTAAELAVHPNTAGLKEASGDLTLASQIAERTNGRLPLYSGCDELTPPLMAIGAVGAISVAANVAPAQARQVTQACLEGRFDDAQKAQRALSPLIRALFSQVSPIPAKAALSMMGLCEDALRLPLTPMEEPHRAQLLAVLKRMGLIKSDGVSSLLPASVHGGSEG